MVCFGEGLFQEYVVSKRFSQRQEDRKHITIIHVKVICPDKEQGQEERIDYQLRWCSGD